MNYLCYDDNDGRITQRGSTPWDIQTISGISILKLDASVIDPNLHYVDTSVPEVIDRPDSTATLSSGSDTIDADGVDIALIENIPDGSQYAIFGPVSDMGDTDSSGYLEFSTNISGIYTIRIISFPEKDIKFEVTAV